MDGRIIETGQPPVQVAEGPPERPQEFRRARIQARDRHAIEPGDEPGRVFPSLYDRTSVAATNHFRYVQRHVGRARQVLEGPDLRIEILRQFGGIGDLQNEALSRGIQPETLIDRAGQLMRDRVEAPVTLRQILRLLGCDSGNDRASPVSARNLTSLPPSSGSGKLRSRRGRVNLGAQRHQHRRLS